MPNSFNHILVCGRQRAGTDEFAKTLSILVEFLRQTGTALSIETDTAELLPGNTLPVRAINSLKESGDLLLVIGGDGSLLQAAHKAVPHNIPMLGINRGRLGFLTDIAPTEIPEQLGAVLNGQYHEEPRFLLETTTMDGKRHGALNDVVLLPGSTGHMIEFDIEINGQLVSHQRADGLIIATPTGSTAYALSGGGPILHPALAAIVIVPMFPHTLSSRPIVVDANATIEVRLGAHVESPCSICCDGMQPIRIMPGSTFSISPMATKLRLIHPFGYNYYETLRSKLKWETK